VVEIDVVIVNQSFELFHFVLVKANKILKLAL
jgi:hypothetical protein